MTDLQDTPRRRLHWLRPIVGDIQFWIPIAVLVGGLLLLTWVA
ncbi:MAG: hypothetical protein P8X82_03340 [Gemmatimonadales bacterium]|jgi:hypothetical protein